MQLLIPHADLSSEIQFNSLHKEWFPHATGRAKKRQFSQLNETLNDIVIGSKTNVGVIENETLEYQTDGHLIFQRELLMVKSFHVKIRS